MKTLRKTLLTGLAALSLGGATIGAQAQTQAPAAGTQHQALTPEQRQAKHAEFAAKRAQRRAQHIARLHDALRITPAQENAWTAFVASMQPKAGSGAGHHLDRAAWAGLSAPERLQKTIDLQKQRTAAMEQRLSALNTFYSVLSADQKKVFDEQTAQMQQHRFGRHHGGEGMQGGWQHRGEPARG